VLDLTLEPLYWKTHIDYRTLKHRGRGSHSLHDLRASTISIPLQNPDNGGVDVTDTSCERERRGGDAPRVSRAPPLLG